MNKLVLEGVCLAAALVLVVSLEPASGGRAPGETPESAPSAVVPGQLEYRHACAQCHGQGGKGDGPRAGTLTPKPTDLTVLAKNNGGTFPERKIRKIIHNTEPIPAHGPRETPTWGKQFSLRENVIAGRRGAAGSSAQVDYRVKQLMQYLRSIQEKN